MNSGAVAELWEASLLLLLTLESTYLVGVVPDVEWASPQAREQWRSRFSDAVTKLQEASIQTRENLKAAADSYVSLRARWTPHIHRLGAAMLYSAEDIDPSLQNVEGDPRDTDSVWSHEKAGVRALPKAEKNRCKSA